MTTLKKTLFLLCFGWLCLSICAEEFSEEKTFLTSLKAFDFSRNTHGTMGVDSLGNIHIVYSIPYELSTPPDNQVWYQQFGNSQAFSPIRVDSGSTGGGRHPSLVIDSNDVVHVVWQDYRHTTAVGNYMDNIEIYYDRKTLNGSFSETDIRLTNTNAGHLGDNGYLPRISVDPQNRLHVVWYDFTLNGNNADIYLINSNENQVFPEAEGIDDYRITSVEQNPSDYIANWMPDGATLPDGSVYVVWGFLRGWQGAFELQGCQVDPSRVVSSPVTITAAEGRYYDPPRLVSDANGNLGLLASAYVDGRYQINFHYKPLPGNWQGPVRVNDGNFDASQPCGVFQSSDKFCIVWQENNGGLNQIQFASLNVQTMQVNEQITLSNIDRDSETPSIAWNTKAGRLAVAWINMEAEGASSIILRTSGNTGVQEWMLQP